MLPICQEIPLLVMHHVIQHLSDSSDMVCLLTRLNLSDCMNCTGNLHAQTPMMHLLVLLHAGSAVKEAIVSALSEACCMHLELRVGRHSVHYKCGMSLN